MRTITKTINVTTDQYVIPELSKIVEILHNMTVLPLYKVVNMYGTEWETFQDFLKSKLNSMYTFENGTVQVDLIDLQTGEVYNEYYTITRAALWEAARDGVIAVPYIEEIDIEEIDYIEEIDVE